MPEVQMNLQQAMEMALGHHQSGRFNEAESLYRQIIQAEPNQPDALHLLGVLAYQSARPDLAVDLIGRAVRLAPGHAVFHNNLGNALKDLGRLEEAAEAYREAIKQKGDCAEFHSNLGVLLKELGLIDDAIKSHLSAVGFDPKHPEVRSNLLLDWHYQGKSDPEEGFRQHRLWDEHHAQPLAPQITPHTNDPNPDRRLRVGYVSPDFREHSVSYYLESILRCHDREKIQVYAYSDSRRQDKVTRYLQNHVDVWRYVVGVSHDQLAQNIRQDQIDILVDLAGHTANNRLSTFARKPAPVQVSYLGFPDTTGLSALDYRICDAHTDPPGLTDHLYSEKLVRLPHCFLCYRPAAAAVDPSPLPALTGNGVTFGSFNTLAKLTDTTLRLWARVLHAVPGSRLLLKATGLLHQGTRARVTAELVAQGISMDRIELAGREPSLERHYAWYHRVDVSLDSYPYNGTTTTCEAMWMGVPVVTLSGNVHMSRVGRSLMTTTGFPELVANTPEEFVQAAATLVSDLPKLAEIRAGLRDRLRNSALMNAPQFVGELEDAYRGMWKSWCASHSEALAVAK